MVDTSELLTRGVHEVIVRTDLEKLLLSGKKIKVYHGIDPTSTRIHLGNSISLRKLRDFQRAGHEVIFLIGSFTALIGDTSDKNAMRVALTQEQIEHNFQTYKEQASKILDFFKTKVVYNGEWLSKLSFKEIINLAQQFTVQQMIERDMYQVRLEQNKPIGLHEFLYPLMQGYDSVALNVDLEIGGTDQTFNMLAGRTLQKIYHNKDKHILTVPLIEGTDGRKMSKSYNNVINISDEPKDQYGKIMSMSDDLIIKYFIYCTDVALSTIKEFEVSMAEGKNPRDYKMRLAREIVRLYHGMEAATAAELEFIEIFQKKGKPEEILLKKLSKPMWNIVDLLAETKLATSKSEARRLIDGGGVRLNDEKVTDEDQMVSLDQEILLQVGKRKFLKVKSNV